MVVTIKDVAKKAGVAPSTVSRVLKNHSSISQETKEKVRLVMKELGYVPNLAAQTLVQGATNAVGVVFPPSVSKERGYEPFFMEILTAINKESAKQNQTVAIATGDSQEELLESVKYMYQQRRVDGFLLLYTRANDLVRDYLMKEKIPYVIVGTPSKFQNETSYVDNDNQTMGQDATEFLLSKGHENILFVTQQLEDEVVLDRFFGYQRALRQANLRNFDILQLDLKIPSLVENFMNQLENDKPTAIIVMGDILALRILSFLQMYGLSVPDDISIISFNDSVFASLIHPYFTSFKIHVEDLGKYALKRLLDNIKGTDELATKVIVPHILVSRESVLDISKK
ncbi:MAG: LacI family transcriptional regulator [Streptococcaceae bacterium]|jgi:LacI family transcriptional regulator|nr:LacI family transcriptional regulator [Streptococcaceae bacterium]